jgi:phosphatidylserine/phosphatidylglycerophosphate/cardiolipin synthase-like enzyme
MNEHLAHHRPLVLALALLTISAVFLAGCELTQSDVEDIVQTMNDMMTVVSEPTQTAGGTVPQPGGIRTPVAATGEGDLWAVYFTDPVIPFDDVVTGGLENNLIDLINNAQSTIDAAMFEFNLQNVADALVAAHERGVQVRVVYDNEHTEDDPQIEQLIDAGIPATPDERSAYMHNKFYVFDHTIVWTGSTNITINDVYRNNNNVIVLFSPEVAANYTAEFEEMFSGQFGPTSPASTPYPGVDVGGTWVETYFSPEDLVMDQLLSVVSEAQVSIHFMAFSFTDYDLAKTMMDRTAAGVEVLGIFESRGANTEYSECPTLLDAGFDVRLDGNPATFHHKIIIIDGAIVATGSFNYSTNATESNDENLLILHNPAIATLYEDEFTRRMADARLPSGDQCLAED